MKIIQVSIYFADGKLTKKITCMMQNSPWCFFRFKSEYSLLRIMINPFITGLLLKNKRLATKYFLHGVVLLEYGG